MPLTLSGTNGVSGVDGSASTPANRGSDTNTGIVYGTDTVQIATGGTTAVTVDSSQRVGIGTASPSQKLHLYGGAFLIDNGTSAGTIYLADLNNYINLSSSTMQFAVNGAERARIDSSGNVGIGTASPQARFHSKAGATSQAGIFEAANSVALLSFVGSSTSSYTRVQIGADVNDMVLYTTGTERMRIDSSGNLLVGRTSQLNIGRLEVYNPVNGQGIVCQVSNNTYSNFQGFNAAGSATFGVTGAGALTKASGTFKIDHPLPALTDTHHLVHSFIEGPQADLIYRGVVQLVDGKATVNIDEASDMTDGTFVLLCREVQCFTSNETNWDAVRGKVTGNILTIESQNSASTASVSWLVIGERQDKHIMETDWTDANGKVIVEPLKAIVGEAK